MHRIALLAATLLAAVTALAAPARATPIAPTGAWNIFDVDELTSNSGGLEWIDLDTGNPISFTFTLSKPARLDVADGGFGGDVFRVFDNGALLGMTSGASNTYPNSVGLDFDAAFVDARYTRVSYLLGTGSHVVTGELAVSALYLGPTIPGLVTGTPLNATVGAVRLTSVPAPGALIPLAVATIAMFALRRRSRLA
jgi:hypothetical protein